MFPGSLPTVAVNCAEAPALTLSAVGFTDKARPEIVTSTDFFVAEFATDLAVIVTCVSDAGGVLEAV
jgi:hypothetical protein